ncbi:hypothetical protein DL96DRAFT_636006 [Flagelloscypha sp. PMI_526]|nr:hypothetical protein DL96DRAFT_636006 [Flagelloscypha sp. PMI_526]
MKSLPDVPLDIARLIVENAAVSDRSTACALSRVSREVQFWSDPFLFRIIVIQGEGTVSKAMGDFINNFISENPTQRILRAQSYVKMFSSRQKSDEENRIPRFIARCTTLEALCLWTLGLNSSFMSINIPSLRRISFSCFRKWPQTFRVPLFRSATHLEIDSADGAGMWDAGLPSISTLTHAVLVVPEGTVTKSVLSTISSQLPPQLEVLLLVMRKNEKASLEGVSHDDRIVIGISLWPGENLSENSSDEKYVYEDEWDTWAGEKPEEHTCWAKAEGMLRYKRSKV